MNLLAVLFSVSQPLPESELSQTEKACLQARLRIDKIVVGLRYSNEEYGDNRDSRRGQMKIWFDGTRLRSDHTTHYAGLGDMNGQRRTECFHCYRSGTLFTYNDTATLHSKIISIPNGTFESNNNTFDPRLLGYTAASLSIIRHGRLDSMIGRATRKDATCTTEQLDGVECRVIRYLRESPPHDRFTIWCDPQRGYHPIRMRIEGENLSVQSDIELQAVPGGFWYPKRVVFVQTSAWKITERDTVEVDEVRINEPLPSNTFSLSGLGMLENTHISSTADREQNWMWRGGKLVKFLDVKRELGDLPDVQAIPLAPPAKTPYWLYVVAGISGVLAIALIRYTIRRPKAS